MTKLLIIFAIWASPSIASDDIEDEICVIGQSYVPPKTVKHPHIIKTNSIDVVLWPDVMHALETEPWDLICKKLCVSTHSIKFDNYSKEIVIKNKSDLKIVWEYNCH